MNDSYDVECDIQASLGDSDKIEKNWKSTDRRRNEHVKVDTYESNGSRGLE